VQTVEFDGHFVHAAHPRAHALSRNGSYRQVPAKCTPHTPTRIVPLYTRSRGDFPRRCSNAGYFTVYSDLPKYKGMCCYHRDAACAAHGARAADCTMLDYGPPTSAHALGRGRAATNASARARTPRALERAQRLTRPSRGVSQGARVVGRRR
jgi:hypothetical protein